MKFPKFLIIGGVKWIIKLCPMIECGFFHWGKHIIKINKTFSAERRFEALIHEICEVIMVNNFMRYDKTNGDEDYLFSFDHDRFDIFVQELTGIIKQIGVIGFKRGK